MNPEQTPTQPSNNDVPAPAANDNPVSQPVAGQTFGPSAAFPAPLAPMVQAPVSDTPTVPLPQPTIDPMHLAPHNRSKKGLVIGLICGVAILLISGVAAASYYHYQTTKPENVLKQALANSFDPQKAKTVHFKGDFSVSEKKSGMTIGAEYKGAIDGQAGAFDVSGKVDALVANLTFDLRGIDGKTYYVRLGGLDGLPALLAAGGVATSYYGTVIQQFNDQWIEINSSLVKQFNKSYESTKISASDIAKIRQAYLDNTFLVIKETLPDEKIGDQNSYHYKIVIDGAMLKNFIKAINDAKIEGLKLDSDKMADLTKTIDEAKFDKYPFELWISKSDKMITQVSINLKDDTSTGKFTHTIESYNKAVKVEKPADAKSLLELMGGFFGGGLDLTNPSSQITLPTELQSGISL